MMKFPVLSPRLVAGLLSTSSLLVVLALPAYAVPAATPHNAVKPAGAGAANMPKSGVEFKDSLPTTLEEVATVDVLSEICPPLLSKDKMTQFNAGYANLLTTMLPGIKSPVLGVKSLHDDAEYMQKLEIARKDAAAVSVEDNRSVCGDVLEYAKNKPTSEAVAAPSKPKAEKITTEKSTETKVSKTAKAKTVKTVTKTLEKREGVQLNSAGIQFH